jgi:hypothetical protein
MGMRWWLVENNWCGMGSRSRIYFVIKLGLTEVAKLYLITEPILAYYPFKHLKIKSNFHRHHSRKGRRSYNLP